MPSSSPVHLSQCLQQTPNPEAPVNPTKSKSLPIHFSIILNFSMKYFLAFRYFRNNKLNNGEITSWGFDFIWTATVVFYLNDVTVFNLIKMFFIGSTKKTLTLMFRTKWDTELGYTVLHNPWEKDPWIFIKRVPVFNKCVGVINEFHEIFYEKWIRFSSSENVDV